MILDLHELLHTNGQGEDQVLSKGEVSPGPCQRQPGPGTELLVGRRVLLSEVNGDSWGGDAIRGRSALGDETYLHF